MRAPYRIRTDVLLAENQTSWTGLDQRGVKKTQAAFPEEAARSSKPGNDVAVRYGETASGN